MDLQSDFIFDDITNVAYPLLKELSKLDSFTKKELVQIILDEDWCGKNMAEKVVDAWLEFERS
tara:strand:+ start:5003 stop:5191 length:189 start_codon:yes stop_codon:yes gene_type:complete